MYWVWASEPTADNEAAIYGPPDFTEEEGPAFDSGLVASTEVPLVEINRDEDSQGIVADNVILRGGGGLLFSSRLRQVLESIAVDNVQYFPAVLRNLVDRTQTNEYRIANIIGRLSCLDPANAVLEKSPDDENMIEFIEVLAIDEAKANGFDLFRLQEAPEIVIASKRVKEACERNGITGLRFYRPCDYEF